MSRISDKKIEKVKSDILSLLYENNLRSLYTVYIADEIARDDEFILKLLRILQKENLVEQINKGKRKKWMMTNKAYKAYSQIV